MTLKYNPLLSARLDETKKNLNDLEDVNTAGTVNGKVLTYQSGTWVPETAAGGGDMLKSVYDAGDDGVVDNSERLEGDNLATVRAHTVDAIDILGTIADANIPDVETLSYSVPFADAQIPTLDATKIISGTFDATQIPNLPTSRITTGTFVASRIPNMENIIGTVPDNKIPDVELLSYGGAFATAQIPNLAADKITTGTFGIARIPTMDDAHVPDLETLSYGGAFAVGQIPNLAASKITTGTFALARIPAVDDARIPDIETLSYGAAFGTAQIPAIGAYKITSGTLAVARHETLDNLNGTVALAQIPTMDDAHVPDIDTLSYGGAFGTGQIPSLPTSKITSGTFDDARIPDTGVVAINYVIDGGGAAISAGTVGFLEVPFPCHVDRWTLLADQHGSVVIDIWRDAYSNYPPTDADSMPGTTNMPAISGTIVAQGTNLSGWGTQGIASGDILTYHVDSCVSIELCTLALKVTKT